MANGRLVAPSSPGTTGDVGGLFVMTYDATGLTTAHIDGWPLLAWNIDAAQPINPSPITLGDPLKTPPSTGAIMSPPWAFALTDESVFVPDTWCGTMAEFFTWLATNNGATRKLSCSLAHPRFLNVWNAWARANPDLVTPST